MGIEVTVYTTNIDGTHDLDVPLDRAVDIDGVKVHYFRSSFPRSWFNSRDLRAALKEHMREFDLVHITSVFLSASTLGAYYARKFGKPYLISPRGSLMTAPLLHHRLRKALYIALCEKRNLRGASAIHFTDDVERAEYLAAGLPLRSSFMIPNGLDFAPLDAPVEKGGFRKKMGVGADAEIVLFLSRISWKKGFDTLIPAFAQVAHMRPRAILAIVGGDDEGYRKNVEGMIRDAGVGDRVRFIGMLKGDAKLEAYVDAQVFVLPSYSENFGMAAAEAMYLRVPTVITSGVALSRYVQDGVSGAVIEKDVKELSRAILHLLSDHALAKSIGEEGRHIIESHFALPKIAGQFIKEYTHLLHTR